MVNIGCLDVGRRTLEVGFVANGFLPLWPRDMGLGYGLGVSETKQPELLPSLNPNPVFTGCCLTGAVLLFCCLLLAALLVWLQ